MIFQKTEKARQELAPGVRRLGQRERTFLLLVDGRRSLQEIRQVLQCECDVLAKSMLQNGFVDSIDSTVHGGASNNPPAPVANSEVITNAAVAQAAPPRLSADPFEGKRSLATTRLFLFDICERMFSRRAPELAEQLRETLRNAKDREAVLSAGRSILAHVESIAGFERADSISERIAMLLPVQG